MLLKGWKKHKMAYYIRKISRNKWQSTPLSNDEETARNEILNVTADAITNCIKTTENKLSLWRVESKNDVIDDIVPIITAFERPDTCDIIYIDESFFNDEGIELEQSDTDANTPLNEFKQFHYNAIVNNYLGLGKFAKIVLKSLGNHKRFKGKEVKSKLQDMLDKNEIEKGMISDKLYEKIT